MAHSGEAKSENPHRRLFHRNPKAFAEENHVTEARRREEYRAERRAWMRAAERYVLREIERVVAEVALGRKWTRSGSETGKGE